MKYKNFDLEATFVNVNKTRVSFDVRVLRSPAGEIPAKDSEPSAINKSDADNGAKLFKALFPGEVRTLFQCSISKIKEEEGLRIRLHLPPELQVYPWESMVCNLAGGEATTADRLALNPKFSIIRYLDKMEPIEKTAILQPARVLFASASPEDPDMMPLRIAQAKEKLIASCKEQKSLDLITLVAASRQSLLDNLIKNPTPIFAFFGHGYFPNVPDDKNKGCIFLEGKQKRADELPAEMLGEWLRQARTRLALFFSCRTAQRDALHSWSGIGPALVKSGVAAVVGMQENISEESALAMAGSLLASLSTGVTIDEAVQLARLTLSANKSRDWATPVLFMRDDTGVIFPEYNEIKDIQKLGPVGDRTEINGVKLNIYTYFDARPNDLRHAFDTLMADKLDGFVGRQFVFDFVDEFIKNNPSGYFIIRGEPGFGKTALMAKLINDRGYIHHFNVASQNIRSTRVFLENICAQLIARYKLDIKIPNNAFDNSGFLSECLGAVAQKAENIPIVIAIDSLDEADRHGLKSKENILYLPSSLPKGVYIVATTRLLDDLPLQVNRKETRDIATDSEDNQQDIIAFITNATKREAMRARLSKWQVGAEEFIAKMHKKSQGNFMYLYYVLPAIEKEQFENGTIDELPEGLLDYYKRHWRQMRDGKETIFEEVYKPIVCMLGVAQEPITISQIAMWTKLTNDQVDKYIGLWREFLVEEKREKCHCYRIYHASFQDFLKEKVDLVKFDEMIASYYLSLAELNDE